MSPMIKVTGGTTTSYFTKVVSADTKIDAFMKDNNMNAAGATIQLNGTALRDTSVTFAAAGVTEECHLFSVVNAKNA